MVTNKSFTNAVFVAIVILAGTGCEKTETAPSVLKPVAFTVVNCIPNSQPIIPVFNAGSSIEYFRHALAIWYPGNGYPSFNEYSPPGGMDSVFVVQQNDTLDIGAKAPGMMFYSVMNLNPGDIYSLFLTGADTSSPDYLFTTDSLPHYGSGDSTVGIRFVNLSTGSNPMSINLEGSSNGSEVADLSYKGITAFKRYVNNSTTMDYLFVIRDAATGDSLTQFDFLQSGSNNSGFGLTDPSNGSNNGNLLTFKNITIVIYGSENPASNFPLNATLIDNY
jgi:hypothetical protein